MSNQTSTTTSLAANERTYEGKPEEVGAQLFSDVLGPTINAAASSTEPQKIARMLAGMLAALGGTIAENFGADAAAVMLRGTADNIERAAEDGQLSGPH